MNVTDCALKPQWKGYSTIIIEQGFLFTARVVTQLNYSQYKTQWFTFRTLNSFEEGFTSVKLILRCSREINLWSLTVCVRFQWFLMFLTLFRNVCKDYFTMFSHLTNPRILPLYCSCQMGCSTSLLMWVSWQACTATSTSWWDKSECAKIWSISSTTGSTL